MPARTLTEIEQDLLACDGYAKIGTVQAAMRYCTDLNRNLLALCQHVRALEAQGSEGPERNGGTDVLGPRTGV